MIERDKVLDALSGVRDPELDEPVTDLGFVSDLRLEDDTVSVRLRLPTYFCAPNFAYLMVADAREAVLSVPGVRRASVMLDDHYASEELNTSVIHENINPTVSCQNLIDGCSHLRLIRNISNAGLTQAH